MIVFDTPFSYSTNTITIYYFWLSDWLIVILGKNTFCHKRHHTVFLLVTNSSENEGWYKRTRNLKLMTFNFSLQNILLLKEKNKIKANSYILCNNFFDESHWGSNDATSSSFINFQLMSPPMAPYKRCFSGVLLLFIIH